MASIAGINRNEHKGKDPNDMNRREMENPARQQLPSGRIFLERITFVTLLRLYQTSQ